MESGSKWFKVVNGGTKLCLWENITIQLMPKGVLLYRCLVVYPNDEWTRFEEKLKSLPLTNKNARQFTRFFLAGAAACEVDKQGRILLPQVLREFASLEKDVVLVGVASRIEIWSRDRWDESMNTYDGDMDEVAENMESLGFSI